MPNFENRTLFIADNLDIMRGMDDETIDLIYLDPRVGDGLRCVDENLPHCDGGPPV